ncbi:BspA family leucine-rich repeat surface protein, partial [Flagellimonas onchidii]|uniref:BspA family leucine-rich repeat surface protein n=1 Tax=Flagellimonas onchidii TaxID=2562684 RepID=UPI00197AD882
MFNMTGSFNQDISNWDVGNVTNMFGMFEDSQVFNQPLDGWDVSSVTNMEGLFRSAQMFNQPIGSWDTSSVENMASMFNMTGSFNQDISNWDVGNVTNMFGMFEDSQVFNQPLDGWDVSSVTNMEGLFRSAQMFNQPIGSWDTSSVENMASMFNMTGNFNQDISGWNVANVKNMTSMFEGSQAFDQPLADWDVSSVTNMTYMFNGAASFDQTLENWNIGQVTSMINMFSGTVLSQTNYDSTLIGWANLTTLQNNVQFDADNNEYCIGEISRLTLIEEFNWTINDGGKNCPFITTWKTDNPGISEDNQIIISTFSGEIYNYTVDWGDGSSDSGVTGDITHTYAQSGTYQVSILGDFPRIFWGYNLNAPEGDNLKLISIDQWGSLNWTSMDHAFMLCSNMDVLATDVPDFSNTQDLNRMFWGCSSLQGNDSFNFWNVENITELVGTFGNTILFNQDIGNWNVSNVTNINGMFAEARSFNQNLNTWNVSNVVDMGVTFGYASVFNQPLNQWDVSKVTNFNGTFSNTPFNQPLDNWDTGNAQDMSNMFADSKVFNQDIGGWDVSSVSNFGGMFIRTEIFNQKIGKWDTSSAEDMVIMFAETKSFDQDLSGWDVSNVMHMDGIFSEAGLSSVNYDKTLLGWSELPNLQSDVIFNAGNSRYCEASDARQLIMDTYGWTINDAGEHPLCNQDNDSDGVLDHKDVCLGSLPGAEVDANGCDIIPKDGIKVNVLTPSCVGSSDGSIKINMDVSGYLMDVSVVGEGVSNEINDVASAMGADINGLAPGSYTVTVTIPEILFEQTYGIKINELGAVTGKRTLLDTNSRTVTYSVAGSKTYKVMVNDRIMHFEFKDSGEQTISLQNLNGKIEIAILGESDCQGKVSDNFFMGSDIQVFPTVTSSTVNFFTNQRQLNVKVFGVDGRLIKEQSYNQNEKSMNVSSLESGLYFLQTEINGQKENIKIVKK